MDEYKIIITPTAINNIKSIALYVAKELYNFKAAYNFLDNIFLLIFHFIFKKYIINQLNGTK